MTFFDIFRRNHRPASEGCPEPSSAQVSADDSCTVEMLLLEGTRTVRVLATDESPNFPAINPANGLPMLNPNIDIRGNVYGTDDQ